MGTGKWGRVRFNPLVALFWQCLSHPFGYRIGNLLTVKLKKDIVITDYGFEYC